MRYNAILPAMLLTIRVSAFPDSTYDFVTFRQDNPSVQESVHMEVKDVGSEVHVTVTVGGNLESISVFSQKTIPVRVEMFDPKKTGTKSTINFLYEKDQAVVNGENGNYSLGLAENTYVNNSALFYILSLVHPDKTRRSIPLNLIQPGQKIIAEMNLTYMGEEKISMDGRAYNAIRYELELTGFARIFWPYKYAYWYETGTFRLLRYEGVNGDRQKDIVAIRE